LWSGPRGRRRDAEDAADVRDRLATPPLAPPEFGPRVGRNRRRFTPPPARRSGVRVDRVVDVRQQQLGPGPTPPVPATAHRRDGRRVLRQPLHKRQHQCWRRTPARYHLGQVNPVVAEKVRVQLSAVLVYEPAEGDASPDWSWAM